MTITQSPTETSTVTNDPVHEVETSTPTGSAPGASPSPRRSRAILSWIAVGAAVMATGVLAVSVIDSDEQRQPNLQHGVGDAKDHPGFGPGATPVRQVTNLTTGIGDTKDHPGFGPGSTPEGNLSVGVGDAKDHAGFGTVAATPLAPNLQHGVGDAKDHGN